MFRLAFRFGLGVLLSAFAVSLVLGQDPADEARKLFKPPESPLEYWVALRFEMDVGRNDLAAVLLRGLVEKKPTDKDLVAIAEKEGLVEVLKLRNVGQWSENDKIEAQARKDAAELIRLVTDATRKQRADPVRMRELITQVRTGTPEEITFALRELYSAGPLCVPYVVEAYPKAKEASDRFALQRILRTLGRDALPPMIAALDVPNTPLQLDLLDTFRLRHARSSREIVPHLWFVSESKKYADTVRTKARELIAAFLELPETRLPLAKVALVREAEAYYRHDKTFGDPKAVSVWRWNDKELVEGWPDASRVSASVAEEYFGLRFARQALELDPEYRPAQLIFLALAIDKAAERAAGAPLAKGSPKVSELLAKSPAELVMQLLDQALKSKNTNVALAAITTLGERGEIRAKRILGASQPPLIQALYDANPRIQFAAARALLQIPGEINPKITGRIVEILGRAITPAAAYIEGRKVLIATANDEYQNSARKSVNTTGYQPVSVSNGRDAIRRLKADAEFMAVILDSTMPAPGLPYLLSQLRQDASLASVPVLLAAVPDTEISRDAINRYRQFQEELKAVEPDTKPYLTAIEKLQEEEAAEIKARRAELAKNPKNISETVRKEVGKIVEQYAVRRKEIEKEYSAAVQLLSKDRAIRAKIQREEQRYDFESRLRENQLARYASIYPNVRVVQANMVARADDLDKTLTAISKEADSLSPAELKGNAEIAVDLLCKMAEGSPPGFEIRSTIPALIEALRLGRVSPEAQESILRIASRFNGKDHGQRAQAAIATVILAKDRPLKVRQAAVSALIGSVQKQGPLLPAGDLQSLNNASKDAMLDPKLKESLDNLIGVLQQGDKATGERMKAYDPRPTAPLPPPKEE
jgi:CheY-like chemotaxis protein